MTIVVAEAGSLLIRGAAHPLLPSIRRLPLCQRGLPSPGHHFQSISFVMKGHKTSKIYRPRALSLLRHHSCGIISPSSEAANHPAHIPTVKPGKNRWGRSCLHPPRPVPTTHPYILTIPMPLMAAPLAQLRLPPQDRAPSSAAFAQTLPPRNLSGT